MPSDVRDEQVEEQRRFTNLSENGLTKCELMVESGF
jgi:hypothetical protein